MTVYTAGAASTLLAGGSLGGVGATMSAGMTVLGGGAAAGAAAGGLMSATAAGFAGAAIGGAVGNIAGQGVAIAMGMQDGFQWRQVGQAALGSTITAGIGAAAQAGGTLSALNGTQAWQAAGRAALSSGINQALHGDWSWKQIVASAVGAGAGAAAGNALKDSAIGNAMGPMGQRLAAGFVGGVAGQWAGPGGKANYGSVFASTLGSVVGDSIVGAMTPQDPLGDFINQKLAEQRDRDLYGLGGAGPVRLGDAGRGARLNGMANDGITPAQRTMLEAGFGPLRAGVAQDAVDARDWLIQNTDYRMFLQPPEAGVGEAAEQAADRLIKRAAEQSARRVPEAAPRVAPFLESAAPWLGKLATGVGLFFHMEDARTTDWTAAGSKFSYNPDSRYVQVTDGETGTRTPIPGISNPSQYSDAQYLAYVSYKANGGALAIDDYVSFDPPDLGPIERTSGLGASSRASSQKPEWLQRLQEGNAFNKERAGAYPYNEVYVNKPSGDGYFRVDSYNPDTREIVSRKFTQFSQITEQTGIDYVKEMGAKYPRGATIANVPTNLSNGLVGETLRGQHILEVPVQIKPIPQAVIDAATRARVLIRDIDGKVY